MYLLMLMLLLLLSVPSRRRLLWVLLLLMGTFIRLDRRPNGGRTNRSRRLSCVIVTVLCRGGHLKLLLAAKLTCWGQSCALLLNLFRVLLFAVDANQTRELPLRLDRSVKGLCLV